MVKPERERERERERDHVAEECIVMRCVQSTSLDVSPLTPVAVVGVVTGHVHFLDLTNVKQPRVVRVIRLHRHPVMHLV